MTRTETDLNELVNRKWAIEQAIKFYGMSVSDTDIVNSAKKFEDFVNGKARKNKRQ